MAQKILGIDLGTNSLGLAVRNADLGGDIINQLEYYSSVIFKSGVGNGKSGEFSYAAERTKYRSSRRLYQSRKYRIWATLRLLIAHGCCPLSNKDLDRWAKYDKKNGLKRQYPVDAVEFEQWVRLDFDCDGIPEYSSPYQLRAELTERPLDWDNSVDRYKFGRAMYHIAQRRGFKSSKGETLKDAGEKEDISTIDINSAMKASEVKPTVGCAFARLEREGIRVRNSEYQAVQSQYREEVDHICRFQHVDQNDPALYLGLISNKKNEGTIFYRRPLRSQKHNIGKCTLEPALRRCPVSHPDYEEFRALSFINNIKFRTSTDDVWQTLSDDERTGLFDKIFTRAYATFKFEDIRIWLEKEHNGCHFDYKERTINYRDNATVAGCPVISRLKKILGDDWRSQSIASGRTRINRLTGEVHDVCYNYEDLWHIAFCSDDYEELAEFARTRMPFDDNQVGHLTRLWSSIQEGYASLSLKAIRNILPMLRLGLLYNEAVALAKVPDIIGRDRWEASQDAILAAYARHSDECDYLRMVYNITNTLISNYKSRTVDERQGYRNTGYLIDNSDRRDIKNCIVNTISQKRWSQMGDAGQERLTADIERLYQQFFASSKRDYYKVPRQSDSLKEHLAAQFPDIDKSQWERLYHHSMIDKFPAQAPQLVDVDGQRMFVCQLGSPDLGSIKNPVALRALHVLRRTLNGLLLQGIIDEDTRVVVETARDMNDANWRAAIEYYQRAREEENKAITAIIKEFRPNYTDADIEKGRLLFEQNIVPPARQQKEKAARFATDMQKYKLWKEQKFQCLYTGQPIGLADLFDDNAVDIEHTIPRSISFDNSLSNKTVCLARFNRVEKLNRIPSELSNYTDILSRIQPWVDRVEHIKTQIELWRGNSRTAATVERKNQCIQQKHLWELEFDYWQSKLRTFTITKDELDQGFRNSQLVDTRIITKYAFHYLKSVFSRVDVQKGAVTADFRKILGVQSVDEKKSRDKHSHHAVDAAVLTMVPSAAQRDRMIELFYQWQEAPDALKNDLRSRLDNEIASCRLGSVSPLVPTIERTILVNHVSNDQTLTPARKARYIGNKRQPGQYCQGNAIRGSLHQETFYGVIQAAPDEQLMVVRKPLRSLSEKDLDTIIDPALRKNIETQVHRFMADEGLSFAKAIEKDFYMLNAEGQAVIHDRNGRPLSPIRHVRCFAKAGRGYLKKATALTLKQQTYLSKHDYKNHFYAQNDDNYLCLYYEGLVDGKTQRVFSLVNYLKTARLGISDTNALFHNPEFATTKGDKPLPLKAIIKKGTRVLIYDTRPDEVTSIGIDALNRCLYVVYKFNAMGTPNLYLRNHMEARSESDCGNEEKGSSYNPSRPQAYLSLKAGNFKALIEHVDFEVDAIGNIKFL